MNYPVFTDLNAKAASLGWRARVWTLLHSAQKPWANYTASVSFISNFSVFISKPGSVSDDPSLLEGSGIGFVSLT